MHCGGERCIEQGGGEGVGEDGRKVEANMCAGRVAGVFFAREIVSPYLVSFGSSFLSKILCPHYFIFQKIQDFFEIAISPSICLPHLFPA